MAAVCMGVEEMGMQTRHRAHTIGLQVRIETGTCRHCGAIEKLSMPLDKINWKKESWDPQVPGPTG